MSSSTPDSPVAPLLADTFAQSSMEVVKFSHIWTIKNFSFCVDERVIESPPFGARSDPGTRWCVELKPKGMKKADEDHVSLNLCRLSSEPAELKAKIEMSLLDADGRTLHTRRSQALNPFTVAVPRRGWHGFTPLSSLLESDSGILPSDKLIVRFEVSYTLGIKENPSQESQIQSDRNPTELLRELHENQLFSDVLLSCDGRDFPAHRAVLAARSPILKAMFELDLKGGRMSRIDFIDMDEETLRNLLRFIYTGETEVPDNMHNLLNNIDKHARRIS